MIDVQVLAVQPHPDQATHNPGDWAVQLCVTHAGRSRTFWRWHRTWSTDARGGSEAQPSNDEIVARFWRDTFDELHGFDFEPEEPGNSAEVSAISSTVSVSPPPLPDETRERCPHCAAGEPSVWDGDLFHYAHPDGDKLKMCHSPWAPRNDEPRSS